MLGHQRLWTHSPIKKLFRKPGHSDQTYINFHKTHAMATHYSGIGDTSMNDPESQDIDSDSQENYQEEHVKFNPPVSIQHLTCEIERLRQTVEDKDNDPRDTIKHLEQKLNQLAITLHASTEPTGEVLNKYTDTLCNAQKKTSLESSLLQDIPSLNGNDSSQLEDWLTDIETASEIMGESRTKLAQAKLRGLVRTLISEALTLYKTWEEIKDSLCLKICNSDIHTSISHFMDIQQKEQESLAAYVHYFKWEASRCKFDNDAATIRIFIKGLKNAHTLATKVYEKGPKSLADTIREVEKLQAAQQLLSTLLPPSLVNTMSSDDNKCFQCQETGNMACYFPHIRAFDCDNYGHVTADCPNKIPPSGILAQGRDNNTGRCDRSISWSNNHNRHYHHDHQDKHRFSRSQSHSHNPRYRSNSHSDSCRSHSSSFHQPSCHSTSCHRSSSTYCYCQDTPHHRSSSCKNFSRDNSTKPQNPKMTIFQLKSTTWKSKDRKYKQVTIDDPPSEYYSSDEQDSNSEDDLN